jgi:hypothetical protein
MMGSFKKFIRKHVEGFIWAVVYIACALSILLYIALFTLIYLS